MKGEITVDCNEMLLKAVEAYHTVANTGKADGAGKQFTIKIIDGIPSISENA